MQPSLNTGTPGGALPPQDAGSRGREAAGWDAFLAGAREAIGAEREKAAAPPASVRRLAGLLAARFDPGGGAGEAARGSRPSRSRGNGLDARGRAWLDGWTFVPCDAAADPAARRLGPEAMARFHEAFAGGLGCVYTASGEVRFMARSVLLAHLTASHPEVPALPRVRAVALLGARAKDLGRIAARLTAGERAAARARLRALRLLDPACGAGAFLLGCLEELVRFGTALGMGTPAAIAAEAVNASLFGVDVDAGALGVTRQRLALAAPGARPNLAAGDALSLDWGRAFPARRVNGDGRAGEPRFDAVLGNPPYVRQERLARPAATARPAAGRPGHTGGPALSGDCRRRWETLGLSGRADLYVYFFLEGLRLLRPGGTLALLTSHAWLDLDYGAPLRAFLLREADLSIIESAHRSFARASVNTVVTLARRRANERGGGPVVASVPAGAPVRFAALRAPFDRAAENPLFTALAARREIDTASLRLRLAARDALAPPAPRAPAPRWGGLWLRGPDVIFRARASGRGRTVPLGEVADVVFGLKTGCNAFFYLDDEGDAGALEGAGRAAEGSTGPWRRCRSRLDGRRHVIETAYLRPVVTTLKEIAGLAVDPGVLRRRVLLVPPSADLARARAAGYLRAGERAGVARRASVSSRAPWYALAPPRSDFLIPRRIGARMPVARAAGVAFDNNLFGLTPRPGVPPEALLAVLNATITRLCVELEARDLTGAQAVVDTNVYLVKAIPVPRPDLLRARADALAGSLRALASRPARSIFDEMGTPDRDALDSLVLSLWGLPAREVGTVQEAVAGLVARRLAKAGGGAAISAPGGP